MAIFISYSHQDKAFVDRLAAELVRERKTVWVDRWELRPGDSLIQRVQEAVGEASALIVVLSKASVASEWCRKELAVALSRELTEKRVVVVPALLEDCDRPPFLIDKLYADFRADFAAGLSGVLEAVAGIGNTAGGRGQADGSTFDWGTEWGTVDGRFCFTVLVVQTEAELPFSVLTTITALADDALTRRYEAMDGGGFGEVARAAVVAALAALAKEAKLSLVLSSSFPEAWNGGISDLRRGDYEVSVTSRRLGTDTGKDTVVHIDLQLALVEEAVTAGLPRLNADELRRLQLLSASL